MKPTVIGKITLKRTHEFTQYGEHAAWTDYVTCEPQTVELKSDGSRIFASFVGVLTESTYPPGARHIGQPAKALIQTQACGGIGGWLLAYGVELNDEFEVSEVGRYGQDCGAHSGMAILALRKKAQVKVWHHEHSKRELCMLNAGHKAELYGECVIGEEGDCCGSGWYWSLPDSEPCGPFDTEVDAMLNAQKGSEVSQ